MAETSARALCCPCGEIAEGWPGQGDEQLCQECWEAQCDRAWWDALARAAHDDAPDAREDEGR